MPTSSIFDMYYGATMLIQERAKTLRKTETEPEKLLWRELKSKNFLGFKFRRQHPISQFIVDFYCHELKLIIDLDGRIHLKPENSEYDDNRTAELERFGLRVIRFTNDEIENEMERVLEILRKEILIIRCKTG